MTDIVDVSCLSVPPKTGPDGAVQLHATTLAVDGAALACLGPSGSGKSALALDLIARGAGLIADDVTWIRQSDGAVTAHCPPAISGQIEARHIGILSAPAAPPAPLRLIVDLGTREPDRVPARRSVLIMGHAIPLLHTPATGHFSAALLHYIRYGRVDDPVQRE